MKSLIQILKLALLLLLLPRSVGAQTYDTLVADNQGRNPYARLVQGSDGDFYGTTEVGGASDNGTVFKVTPAGALTTLVSFNGTSGRNPKTGLVAGNDGNFYGTTEFGGANDVGTVFKVTPAGVLTKLVNFSTTTGSYPRAGLLRGSDGNFYGTTAQGGASDNGTVFKVTPTGTLTTLVSFNATNGRYPRANLVAGSDGNFYGTTEAGGTLNLGTVFKVTPAGAVTTLVSFITTNGSNPYASLVAGSDGNFYGTTANGGANSNGTVFKVTPAGALTTLVSFNGTTSRNPIAGLVAGSDGNFYGTTQYGSGAISYGTVFKMTPAGALTTLVNFTDTNGSYPYAGLVAGSDGNVYGTTSQGGAIGKGTVFKVTPAGALTTLVSFANARYPIEGLVAGKDGNFYGTTEFGGASNYGTVFKVTPAGALTTLVNFTNTNGSGPRAGLAVGSDGNLYGTTSGGGSDNVGTVFRVTPAGVLTTLVNFATTNGNNPKGGLVAGSDGNFYGTTSGGGAVGANAGTVFKVTPAGALTTLVSFNLSTTGRRPHGRLVVGSDGNLYGTTTQGGASDYGTVFKVTPAGALTTLVSFNLTNGRNPRAGLVAGSDGNFYGTTANGGASDNGTVFKVTPAGALTTLVNFATTNGSIPYAGLAARSDGNFYGATSAGGLNDKGTVFKVTPGGALTTLYSFDGTSAAAPQGTPIFASDGNLYGTANALAIWRMSFDTTTLAPTLTAPVSSAVTGNPVNVAFTLPEAALAGSVKLSFGATQLALAASQSTAGAHTFTFNPANPTASAEVAIGAAVADGTYTVTLSYQDAQGNPAASAVSTNVTVDTATIPPTLTTPAANSFINSTVNVAFTLPEAAQPGSVTLTFASPALTRVLTLAASQETAGAHSFSFDAGAPAAAAEVESGLPLEVDGAYTVTLSYRDALGNPAATAVAANVTLDTQPPVVGGAFSPVLIAEGALPDYRSQATGDAVSYTQTPAPGTMVPSGTVAVFMSGTDAAGNVGQTYFYVRVVPAAPIRSVLGSKGGPVPGAGVNGSGIPAGAVWATFGVPSINDAGQAAVLATYKVGALSTTAILGWALADPEDMVVIAKKGAAAPDITNAMISAMKDPLLGPDGSVAWVATLVNAPGTTGAIGSTNNVAIFLDPDAAGPLDAFVVARKGAEATGPSIWKSFGSVALGANAVAFTGTLETRTAGVSPGPGGATTLTDSGLWVYNRRSSTLTAALREGDPLLGSAIKTFHALVARPGSAGNGRGVESDGVNDFVRFRVTLADGLQAIGFRPDDSLGGFDLVAGGDAIDYGAGAKWQSFGLPTQASLSAALAFVGTVKAKTGTATTLNNVAIFAEDDEDYIAAKIVGKGDAAPGVSGGLFSTFKDPVSASNRSVAFAGAMKTVVGVTTAANNDGIWWNSPTGLSLVAREGAQPPEAPAGAQWKAFTSLALPEGRGPIFVASMHSKIGTVSPGPGGVTTANDVGLWATDSFGALRLLMREGDAIGSSTVKSFTVLSNVLGSPAQTRSFNNTGSVIVKATDATGAQHLLHVAVP